MMKLPALSLVGLTSLLLVLPQLGVAQQRPQYDSAHAVLLEMTLPDGVLYTRTPGNAKAEISKQLQFTVGQFNSYGSVAELAKFQVSVNGKTSAGPGLYKISYAAQGVLAWNNQIPVLQELELVLPGYGSPSALQSFLQTYGKSCADEPESVLPVNYWYHYRPLLETCALRSVETSPNDTTVVRLHAQFKPSSLTTEGRSPEYGKLWEDGKLKVTFIFGKYKVGGMSEDEGVKAFEGTKAQLEAAFGRAAIGMDEGKTAAFAWNLGQGQTLTVAMRIVDELASATADDKSWIQHNMVNSDVVAYMGHAGLGVNVRALAGMARFKRGRYQIYLVNGCDTFAYVDDALFKASAKANPGAAPTKYLDIITDAMPSFFQSEASNAVALLRGLVGRQQTYRQILSGFDPSQKTVVKGEEDNLWPNAF